MTKAEGESLGFYPEATLQITKSDSSIVSVNVELADTPEERARGLMFRRTLPDDGGMWFEFDREQMQSFWMKNTYLSLDIIYADAYGKIVDIHENTVPHSTRSVVSKAKAQYVLEVKSGYVKRHGLKVGDIIKRVN